MISEQKSEPTAQIVQNSYHLGHWLFAVGLVATVTFGFMLAITEGIINPNSSDGLGLIVLPVASGLALAIANRRVLWWGAWFALPFLFCISMLISFGGIIIAGSLELKKNPDTLFFMPILVENLPFFIGGLFLYRGYASLAGRGSFFAGLMVAIWAVATSVMMFGEIIKDANLLFTLFWAGSAMWLSVIHWQQPFSNKKTS
jgi:hypothetical protein